MSWLLYILVVMVLHTTSIDQNTLALIPFVQERAKQAKKRPAPAKSSSKLVDLSKSGEEEGVLDNLLECLQSGSALQPARYNIILFRVTT